MKYVMITGANGGMGRAVAGLLASRGYGVFAADRDACEAGERIIPLQVDVTDEESVADAFDAVRSVTDELYGIIHLAGIYCLNSLVEMTPSEFERVFRVNLGGAFLVNRTFLPLLKEGSRVILVTSELAVRDPLPFTGVYGIAKTALDKYAYSFLCFPLEDAAQNTVFIVSLICVAFRAGGSF